jgi:hypothetical protein
MGGPFRPGTASAPLTIEQVLDVFDRWLVLEEVTPIYAVLGTIAGNLLPGDPIWLGLIGPPSSAKTEILNATARLPCVVQAATLTQGALLSGTPKKQHERGAKGGLLRHIGDLGIIVLKDFGSILSMRPDESELTRLVKDMNFLSEHRSSIPICVPGRGRTRRKPHSVCAIGSSSPVS